MITNKAYFTTEIEKTAVEVKERFTSNCLSLCILTDTHISQDGTWEDTTNNISGVLDKTKVDGIIHLGDFTDGNFSKQVTSDYVNQMMKDLKRNGVPVYVTPGNHDANFLKGNPEPFSREEQVALFEMEAPFYYKDFDRQKIRGLFLYSYDITTPVRYGFSKEELEWVEKTLEETPDGYKVIIFSHEAPLPWLDFWSHLIRNGDRLMEILESYNQKENRQILAYLYGHTHSDLLYMDSSFPIISIGCNKCEQIRVHQIPKGAVSYSRERNSVTQDLWDIVLVNPVEEKLEFIRFGAGENRTIDCHKRVSTWREKREEKRRNRKPKIWAERGSSSFAPENTMPAFEVAKDLYVDGITVDVCRTKDNELVAIRQTRLQQISDSTKQTEEYTLEELRQFQAEKDKPMFGCLSILTLKEVLSIFSDTDYTIYILSGKDGRELTDIKESVVELAKSMNMENQLIFSISNLKVHYADDEKEAVRAKELLTDVVITKRPGVLVEVI